MSFTTAKVSGLLSFQGALPNPGQRKQLSRRRQGTSLWAVVHPGLEPLDSLFLQSGGSLRDFASLRAQQLHLLGEVLTWVWPSCLEPLTLRQEQPRGPPVPKARRKRWGRAGVKCSDTSSPTSNPFQDKKPKKNHFNPAAVKATRETAVLK